MFVLFSVLISSTTVQGTHFSQKEKGKHTVMYTLAALATIAIDSEQLTRATEPHKNYPS